ncbi:MAG TPA: methyltransferase domain-containing protein, partial [Frankiaceae bacterium]|nr:methyltransferase domain-containing protein [Frankiaceae bacterium]
VDAYDAARPSYPDQTYADLARLARPLAGADVIEVGAGTGIATRQLLARGARVIALDLGAAMLARLRDRTPGVAGVLLGDGEAMPFAAGVADLVCCAQAWHWLDLPRATAEAMRVLRRGGALAVWWNDVDAAGERWWRDQQRRIEAGNPGFSVGYRRRDWAAELRATGLVGEVTTAVGRWARALPLPEYETWLRSKSYVAALGERLADFLAQERASLLRAFPDGVVVEPFRTLLVVARKP